MSLPQSAFEGKTILITGGARNIGLAVARVAGGAGARVVLADICGNIPTAPYALSTRKDLELAVAGLQKQGVDAMGRVCDVRKEPDVRSMVREIMEDFGRIDMLVNNAGIVSLQPVASIRIEAWRDIVDTCLTGAFLCSREAIPHMIAHGSGGIVNIASVAGMRGLGLSAHYCAAKHGLIGLTRALAVELADHNITVNAVCPGTTTSPTLEGLARQIDLCEAPYAHFARDHRIKEKQVTPGDIANTVCWLLSDAARLITGAVIPVDSGWTAG